MTACSVLGIDVSSHQIALTLLDENTPTAITMLLGLDGATPFQRLRKVPEAMPPRVWYDNHGIYLAAIETPKSGFYQSLAAQLPIYGAVAAALPADLEVWAVTPWEWRQRIGLKIREKPTPDLFPGFTVASWPQDSLDALAVALYARETNATGITRTLGAA